MSPFEGLQNSRFDARLDAALVVLDAVANLAAHVLHEALGACHILVLLDEPQCGREVEALHYGGSHHHGHAAQGDDWAAADGRGHRGDVHDALVAGFVDHAIDPLLDVVLDVLQNLGLCRANHPRCQNRLMSCNETSFSVVRVSFCHSCLEEVESVRLKNTQSCRTSSNYCFLSYHSHGNFKRPYNGVGFQLMD